HVRTLTGRGNTHPPLAHALPFFQGQQPPRHSTRVFRCESCSISSGLIFGGYWPPGQHKFVNLPPPATPNSLLPNSLPETLPRAIHQLAIPHAIARRRVETWSCLSIPVVPSTPQLPACAQTPRWQFGLDSAG